MDFLKKNAYAKINLTLEILDKTCDGYHNIRSIMHKVTLCDCLEFYKREDNEITLFCDKAVCEPQDNLAYKAAVMYKERYNIATGCDFGVDIRLYKTIPDRAGLAGGSADCACVLDTLYEMFPGVQYGVLEEIAASLGSDINFCLDKYKCAKATGRGIILESTRCLPECSVIICVPDFAVKTSLAYSAFDKDPVYCSYNCTETVQTLLNDGKAEQIPQHIFNSFSSICEDMCDDITRIKKILSDNGAFASEMSGSGSSVYGLFDSEEKCKTAAEKLKLDYKNTFICKTITE